MTCVIDGWHPAYKLNGGHGHWTKAYKAKKADAKAGFVSARTAGWERIEGRVRLTVVLAYPGGVLPDPDNLHARVKGLLDGLKGHFFEDDSPKWLDLVVLAERGPKETRMELVSSVTTHNRGSQE